MSDFWSLPKIGTRSTSGQLRSLSVHHVSPKAPSLAVGGKLYVPGASAVRPSIQYGTYSNKHVQHRVVWESPDGTGCLALFHTPRRSEAPPAVPRRG